MNAICERVIGTLRRELLDRVLILGPGHLRRILAEYVIHYNGHRPHQSLAQRSPDTDPLIPAEPIDLAGRHIKRRPILGGPSTNTKPHERSNEAAGQRPDPIFVRDRVEGHEGPP
jgi:hypothetical protein